MQMTDLAIKKLSKVGRHTDDMTKGLHLWIKPTQQKYWIFRYTLFGTREGMSLGSYPEISLKQARERAVEARNKINKGLCPVKEKKAKKIELKENKSPIFSEFSLDYIEKMRPKWRNKKHGEQWVSTIKTYAFPVIGAMPLDKIDTPQILEILSPIWLTKAETASRLRGRIEKVISAAITLKLKPPGNPASWRGHLENLLPTHRSPINHHAALHFEKIPEFMTNLREMDSLSALALEFTILNASRTNEVLRAKRSEIHNDVWTIPASRMKTGKQHQVPLCERSLQLLEIAKCVDPNSEYIFSKNSKPLSSMSMLMMVRRMHPGITVHGFRSSFRDWVSELTDHSPEVAEMALAHTIGNKVEQAYRRGNLLERRRKLMIDWATYCQLQTCSNTHRAEDAVLT